MTVSISEFIDVTVTDGTRPIQQASFEIPLFLASVNIFSTNELVRTYTSTTAMAGDGFPTNHPAYLFAERTFGQDLRPNSIKVGAASYTAYKVVPTVADDAIYTIVVGVEDFVKTITFTSDSSATATEIVDGLVAAITADTDLGDVTPTNVSDELVVTPDTGKETFVVASTDNLVVSLNGAQNVTTALTDVTEADNEYFFLAGQSKADADILLFAAFAEANDKMYAVEVDATTVASAATDDIASQLRTLQYDNTLTWTTVPDNLGEENNVGGVFGAISAAQPGTTTLFPATITGAAADTFTATERGRIETKNSNYYAFVGGSGSFVRGRVASGKRFDAVRFSLWSKARTAEGIWGLIKRKRDLGLKVPYTSSGFEMIRQAIFDNMINVGIRRGAISTRADGAEINPIVRIPDLADIPVNDRTNRILPDVEVEFFFSSAVEEVRVRVFVQV